MVGELIVYAAAVDIKVFTEVLHRNARAFDMPSGISHSPGRLPLEFLIVELGLCEPEDEICFIALVAVSLNALSHADLKVFLTQVAEDIILIEFGGIKIDIPSCLISIAFFDKRAYYSYELIYAVGSRLNHIGGLDIELFAVIEKCIGIELCYLHNGLMLTLCAFEHLIVTRITVRGQMSYIGDIHYSLHIIADIAQILFEDILHDIASEVTDMCEVINCRAAGIHSYLALLVGDELFFSVGRGIIKLHNTTPYGK